MGQPAVERDRLDVLTDAIAELVRSTAELRQSMAAEQARNREILGRVTQVLESMAEHVPHLGRLSDAVERGQAAVENTRRELAESREERLGELRRIFPKHAPPGTGKPFVGGTED